MTQEQVRALPRDLPSLTSLRAVAAMLVFVYHVVRWDLVDVPAAGLGETGVAFFFVLSGFLLTWGYARAVEPRRFYVRRFARVWPSHAVMWLVALLVPITAVPVTAGSAALSLPLLQAWVPTEEYVFGVNGVSWSLSCEIAFYAAFPLVLPALARRPVRTAWLVAGGAFLVASLFVVLVSLSGVPTWLQLIGFANPVLRLPEFVLGIAAALAVRSGWRPSWRLWAVSVALGLGGLLVLYGRPASNVWTTPLYLLVIVAAVRWDCSLRSNWLAARPLVYAGKVSFAFYLVHEVVIINLREVVGGGIGGVVVMLAVAAAGAVVLHHAVELPAQRAIVKSFHSSKRTPPSDPVSA